MNLKKLKITSKGLYWGLILTFAVLYLCVGFVSTLHSITFFHLANTLGLAVLLGLTYEVGQASVLFSILMTKGKEKFLPWALMFLLTALQVTANVYASFKFMANSGSNDWTYWQKSILFGVQAANPEMYQVIISWIAGALLPVVALGMTALVAQNIKLAAQEGEAPLPVEKAEEIITNEVERRLAEVRGVEPPEEKPEVKPEEKSVRSVQEILDEENHLYQGIWKDDPALINGLPTKEEQAEAFKNAILSNVQKKASPMEEHPVIGEGGVQIVRPQIEMNVGPTEEEATIEFEKSLVKDKITIGEGGVQMIKPQFERELTSREGQTTEPRITIAQITKDKVDSVIKNSREQAKIEAVSENEQRSNDMDEDINRYADMYAEENAANTAKAIDADIIKNLKEGNTTIPETAPSEATKIVDELLDKSVKVQPVNKVQGWHFMKEFVDNDHNVFQRGAFVKNDPEKTPTESKKA